MSKKIRIAVLGLGHVGEVFAQHFLQKIQENNMPVEIVAVADHHVDSPVALGFMKSNIPVLQDSLDIVDLGEQIDIIFDLTGNNEARGILRLRLQETGNRHTIIVPEMLAQLLWHFFEAESDNVLKAGGGGYSSSTANSSV